MSWLGKPAAARARPTRHIITAHQQTAKAGIGLSWLGKPAATQALPTRHIITAHQPTAEAGIGLRHTVAAHRQGAKFYLRSLYQAGRYHSLDE